MAPIRRRVPLLALLLLAAPLARGPDHTAAAAAPAPDGRAALPAGSAADTSVYAPAEYSALRYRMVGPHRGGRSTAVTGSPADEHTFYMGTTGGGVWRTDDAGQTWTNVSDGYFGGDVGAVQVADSDASVIYVGTGSACIRGNVSTGRGVWKSEDGGESWRFVGLPEAGQIGRVLVHPEDPDLVYVAALGHPFGKNEERGVYRSEDGGESWERVLFVSDSIGAVDLAFDPENPREIYAAMWRAERDPWKVISGAAWSAGAGLYRSRDGGDSWTHLSGGLPAGDELVGRIGVTVSPAEPDRVWALVEAEGEQGGLYRSDDGGDSWELINGDHRIRSRPFYYTHVFAHPKDANTVYVLSGGGYVSTDGGETFPATLSPPHWDQHDLWIDPDDPETMIIGNDGGGQVTVDGGESWSTYFNQPTGQFYRVEVDDRFPYRIYGTQQDNGTITVPYGMPPGNLPGTTPRQYWYSVAAGEAGHIAVDPRDPDVTYAGDHGGRIDRADQGTQRAQNVQVYPEAHIGVSAESLEYRFQWNAPIEISPHDPDVVYHAAQKVMRTTDGGHSWTAVSPDLSYDDPSKQGDPGGPITRDATGVEVYNTVFALTPSPHERGTIWAGTDDGRIWITRSGGGTSADAWTEVTPEGLPKWSTVNTIEVSPHDPGTAYASVYRYRLDDFAPYVYRTEDHGRSWTRIVDGTRGIPADHPVRVVREDPEREGLLYAGTEFGMYVSFDDGRRWRSLQLNLPTVPVTDLVVHRGDLVVATQGRAFWVLDDVSPLRQLDAATSGADVHLYRPRHAYRIWASGSVLGGDVPEPPPAGPVLYYALSPEAAGRDLRLEIGDGSGRTIRTFTADAGGEAGRLTGRAGLNRFVWNLRTPGVDATPDAAIWGPLHGVRVPPGTYRARLIAGPDTVSRDVEVRMDPRLEDVTAADLREQFRLATAVRDTMSAVFDAVRRIREARERTDAESLTSELSSLEGRLLQVKNEVRSDAVAHPPRLVGQLARLYGYVGGSRRYSFVAGLDAAPTRGAYRRFEDLNRRWADLREELGRLLGDDASGGT